MRHSPGIVLAALLVPIVPLWLAVPRQPASMAFRVHMLDPGESETAAVADLNNDHRPDIISAENWYEAPNWAKHPLRVINRASGYVDDFSDLPVDVDGDGYIDIVQIDVVSAGKTGLFLAENLTKSAR